MKKIYLLLLFGSITSTHAEVTWKLVKDKHRIKVYSMQQDNQILKQHKAVTLINQNVDTILAALQDTEACSEWVHNCISNKMVEMTDTRHRVYHTTIHSPLWFKDRDFYLQSDVSYDSKLKQFTINLTSKPDYAPTNKGVIRITDVTMVWQLQSINKNKTLVTYQVYIDPKLPLKSINHQSIKTSVFASIRGLKRLAKRPEYANNKLSAESLKLLTH